MPAHRVGPQSECRTVGLAWIARSIVDRDGLPVEYSVEPGDLNGRKDLSVALKSKLSIVFGTFRPPASHQQLNIRAYCVSQ